MSGATISQAQTVLALSRCSPLAGAQRSEQHPEHCVLSAIRSIFPWLELRSLAAALNAMQLGPPDFDE
jgi:hypothetical protein